MTTTIKIKLLDPRAQMPKFATEGSAGFDLAALDWLCIPSREQALIKTGVAMAIPAGYAGEIQPRSGLALKYGITITNSPGLIDSDYRGEIGVIIYNSGVRDFVVEPGDRIAQMKIIKLPEVVLVEADELDETERTGGFGSTGVSTNKPRLPTVPEFLRDGVQKGDVVVTNKNDQSYCVLTLRSKFNSHPIDTYGLSHGLPGGNGRAFSLGGWGRHKFAKDGDKQYLHIIRIERNGKVVARGQVYT